MESYKLITSIIEESIESENNNKIDIDCNLLINSIQKGDLNEIKNIRYNEIDFSKKNAHGTILHYAVKYSDTGFLKLAFKLGARIDTPNNEGHTLLEYACLEHDPNMIFFLEKYGANMNKHLFFRDGTQKFLINNDSIDILILLKFLLCTNFTINKNESSKINDNIKILGNLLDLTELVGLNNFTVKHLIYSLKNYLQSISEDSALSFLEIINEEFNFIIFNKLGCPRNKIEVLLINLVPFIDNFQFNISIEWMISLEIKYIIKNIFKKNKKLNSTNIKLEIIAELWTIYIKTNLLTEDYVGGLIYQWIVKMKV